MRLFSNKSYTFQKGELEVSIKNQEIKDMPDWIEETLLFKLAKKEGSISIIETPEQLKAAENGKKNGGKAKEKNTDNKVTTDSENSDGKDK